MESHPFRGLVQGRLLTYFDEAFVEYGRGRLRGAYDYGMLALNTTLFELRPGREPLFQRLAGIEADGRIGPEVLAFARGNDFLERHDRGITDMDLSYMSLEELQGFVRFLEIFYRSLAARGTAVSGDPRGN
jgi:hypothetical protein